MSNVDLFDDLETADAQAPVTQTESDATATDQTDTTTETQTDTAEVPEEILTEVPEGCVSVSAFAEYLIGFELTTADGENIRFPFGKLILPQKLYQAASNKKDPLPHVRVRTSDQPADAKPTLFIDNRSDAALEWYKLNYEKNLTRGSGATNATSASKRSAEVLTADFQAKLPDLYWAKLRMEQWTEKYQQAKELIGKYETWLKNAGVSEDEVTSLTDEAEASWKDEQAQKAVARKRKTDTQTEVTAEATTTTPESQPEPANA